LLTGIFAERFLANRELRCPSKKSEALQRADADILAVRFPYRAERLLDDPSDIMVDDERRCVPIINRLAECFDHVALTQDWHPSGHSSFATSHPEASPFESVAMPYGQQTLWPDHCRQGTEGAAFHPRLEIDRAELIIRKGFRSEIDSYSAFFENDQRTPTGLAGHLRDRGLSVARDLSPVCSS
jgi:nicotinamidase-related amidase